MADLGGIELQLPKKTCWKRCRSPFLFELTQVSRRKCCAATVGERRVPLPEKRTTPHMQGWREGIGRGGLLDGEAQTVKRQSFNTTLFALQFYHREAMVHTPSQGGLPGIHGWTSRISPWFSGSLAKGKRKKMVCSHTSAKTGKLSKPPTSKLRNSADPFLFSLPIVRMSVSEAGRNDIWLEPSCLGPNNYMRAYASRWCPIAALSHPAEAVVALPAA